MSTTIYLTRHGVTPANKENRFAGRTAEPLHADGVVQLQKVAEQMQDKDLAAIYAGPLPRTRQSAEIVQKTTSAPVTLVNDITEINLPHWDGLTKDEIRSRFGKEYPTWLEDPAGFFVPNCETISDVQKRAVSCLERIFAEHVDGNLLVVSHLIVIRSLILHYTGHPIANFRSIKVANAKVVALERENDGETRVIL